MIYDLTILGGGPGGYVAAIRAAQQGAKVALIEKEYVGGTCLNYGCIPTKSLIRSVEVLETVNQAKEFGVKAENMGLDLKTVIERKEKVVETVRGGVEDLISSYPIDMIYGTGRCLDKNTIEIEGVNGDNHTIVTDKLIIATGSQVYNPGIAGADLPGVINSKGALSLEVIPDEVCIVGGGVIGIEFAYILNAFGAKVKVLELLPEILEFADKEMVGYLKESLTLKGVEFVTNAQVKSITKTSDGLSIVYSIDGEDYELDAGLVLLAMGRIPQTKGVEALNLDEAGRNGIAVNAAMETNIPGVYAIGDVTGGAQLAHLAMAQGLVAADNAVGGDKTFKNDSIPYCIYCKPEMAWVGLTEDEAREKFGNVKIGRFPFTSSGKALVDGDTEGLVKLIIDEKYGEIVGLHLIGPESTNMIAEGVLARMLESTAVEMALAIHPHPTLSEVLMEAAYMSIGEGIHYR